MFTKKIKLNKSSYSLLIALISLTYSLQSNAMTVGLHSSTGSSGFAMHDGSTRYIYSRGGKGGLGTIAFHSISGGKFYTGFGLSMAIPNGGIDFGGGADGAFSLMDKVTLEAPGGVQVKYKSITFYAELVAQISTKSSTSIGISNSFGIKFDI